MTQDEKPTRSPLLEALEALNDIPAAEHNDAQKTDKKATLETQMLVLDVQAKAQTIQARETHSKFVLWVITIWLAIVLGIIILSGFCPVFHITEKTLIALIGSTTANVLGFYVIILKYFFHSI